MSSSGASTCDRQLEGERQRIEPRSSSTADPIGTVMRRLSRARQALRDALDSEANASLAAEYLKTS
jgi:hypothetical protein